MPRPARLALALVLFGLCCARPATAGEPPPRSSRPVHTYSIVARDAEDGRDRRGRAVALVRRRAARALGRGGRRGGRHPVVRRPQLRQARARPDAGRAVGARRPEGPARRRRERRGTPGGDPRRQREGRRPHRDEVHPDGRAPRRRRLLGPGQPDARRQGVARDVEGLRGGPGRPGREDARCPRRGPGGGRRHPGQAVGGADRGLRQADGQALAGPRLST